MIDVTQLDCPARDVPGTHHLRPQSPANARSQTCRDCGKTEKQLRDSEEQRLRRATRDEHLEWARAEFARRPPADDAHLSAVIALFGPVRPRQEVHDARP